MHCWSRILLKSDIVCRSYDNVYTKYSAAENYSKSSCRLEVKSSIEWFSRVYLLVRNCPVLPSNFGCPSVSAVLHFQSTRNVAKSNTKSSNHPVYLTSPIKGFPLEFRYGGWGSKKTRMMPLLESQKV